MERFKGLRNIAIVLLIALAVTVVPGGGRGVDVVLWILTIAFFTAIAFAGYRVYRENRFTLDSLSPLERWVAYGALGLAFVAFTATSRLFDLGGGGVLIWLAVLGICSYAIFWVWRRQSEYG